MHCPSTGAMHSPQRGLPHDAEIHTIRALQPMPDPKQEREYAGWVATNERRQHL